MATAKPPETKPLEELYDSLFTVIQQFHEAHADRLGDFTAHQMCLSTLTQVVSTYIKVTVRPEHHADIIKELTQHLICVLSEDHPDG